MKRSFLLLGLVSLVMLITACTNPLTKISQQKIDQSTGHKTFVFKSLSPISEKDGDLFKASIKSRINYFGYQNPQVNFIDQSNFKIEFDVPDGVNFTEAAFERYMLDIPTFEIRIKQDTDKIFLSDEERVNLVAYNKQALALANKLLKMAQEQPDSFAELAKKYSQDPGSKENGGLYVGVKKGQFVPEYDAVIFGDLESGQIYPQVVETTFGYHIIKKEAQRGEGDKLEIDTRHILIKKEREHDILMAKTWRKTGISGLYIDSAAVEKTTDGKYIVKLKLNQTGGEVWAKIVQDNPQKEIVIFVDGVAISQQITDKSIDQQQVVLTANFSEIGAKKLVERLSHGVLEVPIKAVK